MDSKFYVEKLKRKGVIKISPPDDYLEEEVRCGYAVSSDMKKVWLVMIDLLVEFDRVCKKHDLQYCVCAGTMLGAVRHKGFIPWDDDMDVQMSRIDYDKLMNIGPKEFKHPYFFQSKLTDPGMPNMFAKLRNSLTTAFTDEEQKSIMEYNKGIFIDIFPVDNIPDDLEERNVFFKVVREKRLSYINVQRRYGIFSECSGRIQYWIKRTLNKLLAIRRRNPIRLYKEFEEYSSLCSRYVDVETSQMTALMFCSDGNTLFNVSDYKNIKLMDFEFIKVPVTCNFDSVLSVMYGNWREMKIYPCHSAFFDVEKSYLNY